MPDRQSKKPEKPQRLRLTVQLSFAADDAIHEIRRRHRRKTGRDLPKWKVIDRAIRAYARQKGIKVGGRP